MLVNPIYGGDGGAPTVFADNAQISDTTQYLTASLASTIPENTWVIIAINEPTLARKRAVVVLYTSGTINVAVPGDAQNGSQTVGVNVTLTNSTVAASYYPGDFRNIYCKVSEFTGDVSQVYDEA